MEDMLAASAYLAETIRSNDGFAEAMNTIVPMYLAKGEVDMAAELSNAVDDPFVRDRLLSQVAEKCADMDDDDYAVQLAEAVEDHGIRAEAFERIALLKASKGQLEKAESIAAEMQHPDFVYAAIAVNKAAAGDDAGAAAELEKIEFPAAIVHALQAMATQRAAAGERDAASELLTQAVGEAAEIDHAEEKIRSLFEIGQSYIEAGQNERAVEVFEAARTEAEQLGNVHRDSFLANAALGFLQGGNVEMADRTLDSVADKTQISSALLGFSRELWKKEERADALEALEEAYSVLKSQREAETRDTRSKMRLFTSIAAQFAGFEKGERAIGIAEEIADDTEKMSALTQIAQVLTMRKENEQARQALNSIPDDGQRVFALLGMSDAAEKNGDRDKALSLLNEAADLGDTVPQLSVRTAAYNEMVKRFAGLGDAARAAAVNAANIGAIASIRDESIRAAMLAASYETVENTGLKYGDDEWETVRSLIRKVELG